MKGYNTLIGILLITTSISCQEKQHSDTSTDSVLTTRKEIEVKDSIPEEAFEDEEDPEQAILKSRIEKTFQESGLQKMFDQEADIDNDSIPDRIVILYDTNETNENYRYGEVSPRPLYILKGLENNRYKIILVNNKTIPGYYCDIIGSPFTELEDIVFNNREFSFSYTNNTHFYYRYSFVYDNKGKTLVLNNVFIKYILSINYHKIENITLTQKDFGRQTIDFFNPAEFGVVSYLEKRYPNRFH
jgi:hypothetical protein